MVNNDASIDCFGQFNRFLDERRLILWPTGDTEKWTMHSQDRYAMLGDELAQGKLAGVVSQRWSTINSRPSKPAFPIAVGNVSELGTGS